MLITSESQRVTIVLMLQGEILSLKGRDNYMYLSQRLCNYLTE